MLKVTKENLVSVSTDVKYSKDGDPYITYIAIVDHRGDIYDIKIDRARYNYLKSILES